MICVCVFVLFFNVLFVIIDKRRFEFNKVEVMNIIGDVKGVICIMIDDIIDIGGILMVGVNVLKEVGVKEVYVVVIYGVLIFNVIERL